MRIILCFLLFIIVVISASCQEEDITEFKENLNSNAVQFLLISTRATDTQFEEGDEIGVYVVPTGAELLNSGNYMNNKRYVIRNGKLVPFTDEDKIYISDNISYDYYAYYPYDPNHSPRGNYITLPLDQRQNKHKSADLMCAKNIDVQGTSVFLNFKHMLCIVECHFPKYPGLTIDSMGVANVAHQVAIDLENTSVSDVNSSNRFKMYKHGENNNSYIYRVILPPQNISPDVFLFEAYCKENEQQRCFCYRSDKENYQYLTSGTKNVFSLEPEFMLTVINGTPESGSVNYPKSQYKYGETVTITAFPHEDYRVQGWYIYPRFDSILSTAPTFSFKMTGTTTVRTFFVLKEEEIKIDIVTDEGSNGGRVRGNEYKPTRYQPWSVQAFPDYERGYLFGGWYQNGQLISTSEQYDFIVPNHTVYFEAHFIKTYYKQTLTKIGDGDGKVVFLREGGGWIEEPTTSIIKHHVCTLQARPYPGSHFEGWYENNILISTANPYSFTCTSERSIVGKIVKD